MTDKIKYVITFITFCLQIFEFNNLRWLWDVYVGINYATKLLLEKTDICLSLIIAEMKTYRYETPCTRSLTAQCTYMTA